MKIIKTSQLALALRIADHIEQQNASSDRVLMIAPGAIRLNGQFQSAISLMTISGDRKVVISSYMPEGLHSTYVFSYGSAHKEEMKNIIFIDDESGVEKIANTTFKYLDGDEEAFRTLMEEKQ